MAMGGLGVSLAGFPGLITAFNSTAISGSPVAIFRLRHRVPQLRRHGRRLRHRRGPRGDRPRPPADDPHRRHPPALPYVRGFLQARPGPSWPDERQRWTTIISLVVLTLATLANLVFASLGYLEVLLMAGLVGPITIFYNTIRDYTRSSPVAAAAPAAEGEQSGSGTTPS